MDIILDFIIKIIRAPFDLIREILRLPSIKGKIGERKVSKVLLNLSKDEELIINNLIIENKISSKSHQIDHIFISKKGIFVIETKNFSGRVYGDDNQSQWTQVLNFGKTKNKFYSPVKQNQTHIMAIKEIIGDYNMFNIVIFVDKYSDYTNSEHVYTIKEFKKCYKSLKEDIYGQEQIVDIYNELNSNKGLIKNKEHISNINKMKDDIDNNICPRCESKIIEKNGKYGKFYACSNYPKCKFTKKT